MPRVNTARWSDHNSRSRALNELQEYLGLPEATVRTRLFYARKEFWKKANKDPILADLTDASSELTRAQIRPIDRGGGDSG